MAIILASSWDAVVKHEPSMGMGVENGNPDGIPSWGDRLRRSVAVDGGESLEPPRYPRTTSRLLGHAVGRDPSRDDSALPSEVVMAGIPDLRRGSRFGQASTAPSRRFEEGA